MTPVHLRADFRDGPIGLDRPPLLTWEPDGPQEAYELEIVDALTVRREGARTDQPRHAVQGPLSPFTQYRWRVRTGGEWSAWAQFETGPLSEPDWGPAIWIGSPNPGPAPRFSAQFPGRASTSLRLVFSGLGTAEVRIDGRPVHDAVLDPPPVAYQAFTPYRVLDVSALAGPGEHTLTAVLGRGFWAMSSPTNFGWHTAPWRSEPGLRLLLVDLENPAQPLLASGAGWPTETTAVLDDSYYSGEVVDFTAPVRTGPAVPVAAPPGELRSVRQPPVTRRERVEIVGHAWTGPARQRFDLAANVTGVVSLRSAGTTLNLKLGEHLTPEGLVRADDPAVPEGLQHPTVTGAPAGSEVRLDLSYAGMRYVEVAGTEAAVEIAVDRISAAPPVIGEFHCNDSFLQQLHDVTRLTLENCLQGTPVDTPIYEKQAYTGDTQLLSETYAYNFWMPTYLGSWFEQSVRPTQSADGSIPGIAPSPPGDWIFDTPSPAWDAALFEIPRTLLRHYGDSSTVRDALPTLRRYLGYLESRFPDGIVDVGLGDWNPPGHIEPPEHPAILSTAYHHRFLLLMAHFLTRSGEIAEAQQFTDRAEAVRSVFDAAFWRESDGWYAGPDDGYRETSNVLAVAFGLAGPLRKQRVLDTIERRLIERERHLDTGIVGTRYLLRVLARSGRSRLAFDVARAHGYPGWRHWLDNGATTLYENWELDGRSHNHGMFGTVVEWLYADVAGLTPGADGWSVVHAAPHLPGDGSFTCAATLETLAGTVRAEWEDHGGTIRGRVVAPSAVPVVVPADAVVAEESRRSRRLGRETEHVLELKVRGTQPD